MGAGSSRDDAPVRRRARLSLAGCFGAGSSAALAADGDGGRPATVASSSRTHEVQSLQAERAANIMGFRASVAAKDIHVSNETDPRAHSSSSTISHHLRFNHLNCHENKEDSLGSENAQTNRHESSVGKDVLLRGNFSNEAVSIDRASRDRIGSIGSELENVTNTINTNEIGGSVSESNFHPSFMTSERIIADLEEEIAPQRISSSSVMSSERADLSQSSSTSMLPNTSTASSVIGESTPDSVPNRAEITILSGTRGQSGGSILHDDMMSIFSSDGLRRYGDSNSSETRRSHRRVLWDALSRRGSRGYPDSDTDDLGFYSTWLDLGDDIFGVGGVKIFSPQTPWINQSKPILKIPGNCCAYCIREHRRAVFDSGNEQSTAACPLGIHQIGRCTCDSFLIAEESSARASISRIVMLTEALFEVLDEIHRQPASLSLSMVSAQAPESVVNSLPWCARCAVEMSAKLLPED
ncbi:hypothetical protein PR202_ga02263 [Eleusine coracana subsp. coracana]|uniref:Uncharacterized protein n=1 Tax=Eleusine coracana subsp. coracana TaxID=191504 RepID=A0AAV5BLA9_ELECO|nr:hypothetical protein PR202_ga02263 [Eleusine coracana subsp. coracana]